MVDGEDSENQTKCNQRQLETDRSIFPILIQMLYFSSVNLCSAWHA